MTKAKAAPRPRIGLALQGGGSHGAFTWGVLDRLLERDRLDVEAISGTSAGALNGALLSYGWLTGGAQGARDLLHRFWRRVAKANAFGPMSPSFLTQLTGNPNVEAHPVYAGFDLMIRMMSPYQFNPLGLNPLADVLEGLIDFGKLAEAAEMRLFVSATNVTQGKMRLFQGKDLSADCLLATACLPFLFQAVRIDGEHYWDGGYMGNPVLDPLIKQCRVDDIVIVQVTPIHRPEVPRAPTAIVDRINEVSFNSTFLRELRSIELVNRLLARGAMTPEASGMRQVHLHRIQAEDRMAHLGVSSKLNADWGFLTDLCELGREAADRWLAGDAAQLGQRSTFETGSLFV
ncbi:patatin-like phospholipase family protein [Niveispirillum fermenti]|uniref:patatin-like phospholipase family protein n=1 Tax=Niveispirillum fermenti TaxID=1233113 RepID=UPI003A8401B2